MQHNMIHLQNRYNIEFDQESLLFEKKLYMRYLYLLVLTLIIMYQFSQFQPIYTKPNQNLHIIFIFKFLINLKKERVFNQIDIRDDV